MEKEILTTELSDSKVNLIPVCLKTHKTLIVQEALKYRHNTSEKHEIESSLKHVQHAWLAYSKGEMFQVGFITQFMDRYFLDSYPAGEKTDPKLLLRAGLLVCEWFDKEYGQDLFSFPDARNKEARKMTELLGFKFERHFFYFDNKHCLMRREKSCQSYRQ